MAAGTPLSGTGMTMSALTKLSLANSTPMALRASYTLCPSILESGLAK